jgi:NAD(P)-dependent dehydrogenase (short-subunit alcohol dehydrogenase family)
MMEEMDFFGLDGTASIVTGGGAGIGRACALLLAQLGSRIGVVDRDADAAAETVRMINEAGRDACFTAGDVRETETVTAAVAMMLGRYDRIDVLVNNAGGMFVQRAEDISPNGWSAVLRLNLDAAFRFSQAVAPGMRAAGRGSIVNVASVAGIAGNPGAAHYGAAKAGLINLARTLAIEWAPAIRVNCVAPDFVRTAGSDRAMSDADRERIAALVPLGRLGEADDVAAAVAFLASRAASFITGQTLVVDGGTLFRSRLDFMPST